MLESGKRVNLPTSMDQSHQSKLDKLKSLNGANFDNEFDEMQRSVHKDATSLSSAMPRVARTTT
jgi:putative membrane protein